MTFLRTALNAQRKKRGEPEISTPDFLRRVREVAGKLGIGEKTVKTHVSRILGKLGVQSRTQAALYAGRVGLVPLDELGAGESDED